MYDFAVLLLKLRLQVKLLVVNVTRFHELVVLISDVVRVEASFGPMVKLLEHLFLLTNVDVVLAERIDVT